MNIGERPTTPELDALIERHLARLPPQSIAALDVDAASRLRRLLLASDFAADTLRRQPDMLAHLLRDARTPIAVPLLVQGNAAEWGVLLRRFRAAESTRLVWRDVVDAAPVDEILSGATQLAERCLHVALAALEGEFARSHGVVRNAAGVAQQLVVFGLGKLGGGELNFSSDIDLVLAYPAAGGSDGPRALAAEDYFARLCTRLVGLLDETSAEGFVHRVDLRLRPFGGDGRIALSFAAMDTYFQREGRDWERYAWLKARAVAGDIAGGEAWLQTLRPFVYRRYLDYTALDGLRAMKALINAEVARKELDEDIKRGHGGIREIEFLVQALQLIHGGRDASLRERGLIPALQALVAARQVSAENGAMLASAYRFLRQLENRLQMLRDAQTHVLPGDASPAQELDRARIALALDFADWHALQHEADAVRARVAGEFAELLAPRKRRHEAGGLADALGEYWRALPHVDQARALRDAGFDAEADALVRDFAKSIGVRELSTAARARLDRVLPALLHAAAHSRNPDAALRRLLQLLRAVLRRASYLALLDEQPQALARLIDVLARSAFLAERLAAFPLLLDELLDARIAGPLPGRADMRQKCGAALHEPDPELALRQLNESHLALGFRIAQAELDHRQTSTASARQLAWLAEEALRTVLAMAEAELVAAHGRVPQARFAIVGYGSLGAEELGFGSDLDLVFLFDADAAAHSDGAKPVEAALWYLRLTRKINTLLGAMTGAGRLYDVDARLRPDGSKSGLVTSLASFRDYQQQRAWTWEHQALVRARGVAGDASLMAQFDALRAEVLARPHDPKILGEDVVRMRQKMRSALDRSDAARFDLKQGVGGLVDIEFLLQFLVLRDASWRPALLASSNTADLIHGAHAAAVLDANERDALLSAHALFLGESLACTLDGRKRIVAENESISRARAKVADVALRVGLDFHGA